MNVFRFDRIAPNSDKTTSELVGRYLGSDGKYQYLSINGVTRRIDPSNPDITLRGVAVQRTAYKSDSSPGSPHSYVQVADNVYETDPTIAMNNLVGKKVVVTRNMDGHDYDTTGIIVLKDGKPHLQYNKVGDRQDISSLVNVDDNTVTQISRIHTRTDIIQRTGSSNMISSRSVDEALDSMAEVKITYQARAYASAKPDETTLSGRYVGWSGSGDDKFIVIRSANGQDQYIPFSQVDSLQGIDANIIEYNQGIIP